MLGSIAKPEPQQSECKQSCPSLRPLSISDCLTQRRSVSVHTQLSAQSPYTPPINWHTRVHVPKSSEPRGHAIQSKSVGSVAFFMGSINTHFRACGKLRAVDRSHSASFPGMWVSTAQVSSPWVNALKSRLDARDGRFWSACVIWFHPQSTRFL